jgi:CBS domain-containing protein
LDRNGTCNTRCVMISSPKPGDSTPSRPASGMRLASSAHAITCGEVMMKRVFTVLPTATVAEAAAAMRDEGIGFLVVRAREGSLVGVLTDRDVVVRACAAGRDPARVRVLEITSPNLMTCQASDPLETAVALMEHHQKSRIVVLDEAGLLAGIISYSDVVQSVDPMRMARFVRHLTARDYRVRGTRPRR